MRLCKFLWLPLVYPRIQFTNLQIKPANDDFDYEGGGYIAKVANHYLKKITDPSGIGKKKLRLILKIPIK